MCAYRPTSQNALIDDAVLPQLNPTCFGWWYIYVELGEPEMTEESCGVEAGGGGPDND